MGSIPGLTQRVKDLVLLWLWCRPAATTLIRPLTWEPPYAVSVALNKQKMDDKVDNHVWYTQQRKCILESEEGIIKFVCVLVGGGLGRL